MKIDIELEKDIQMKFREEEMMTGMMIAIRIMMKSLAFVRKMRQDIETEI